MKTKNVVRTRVNTVTCPGCKVEFYSRARHDYRICGCSSYTMVDGGFDYFKRGGKDLSKVLCRIRYINATRSELYQDWNQNINKFGVINAK